MFTRARKSITRSHQGSRQEIAYITYIFTVTLLYIFTGLRLFDPYQNSVQNISYTLNIIKKILYQSLSALLPHMITKTMRQQRFCSENNC